MMEDAPSTAPGASARTRSVELTRTWLVALVAIVVVGIAMRAMAVVVTPIIVSIILALVVAPVRDAITSRVPGWLGWLGHLAAVGVILLVVAVFIGGIWLSAVQIMQSVPEIVDEMEEVIPEAGAQPGIIGDIVGMAAEATDDIAAQLQTFATGAATGVLESVTTVLFSVILIFFVTLFILIEGPRWRAKLSATTQRETEERWIGAIDVVAHKLRLFLIARAAIGLLTAVLYVAWLGVFGVDLLLVWAVLALLLGFIPNIGAIISGALPAIYALLTMDLGTGLIIAGGLLVIEQITGNYIDPKVQGRQISLSPLVVLLTIVFWGWFWGVTGMLLAVPLTIAICIICAHIPTLRPLALFLTDKTDLDGLDEVAETG
jgi:AI-2 transport protein TqsA